MGILQSAYRSKYLSWILRMPFFFLSSKHDFNRNRKKRYSSSGSFYTQRRVNYMEGSIFGSTAWTWGFSLCPFITFCWLDGPSCNILTVLTGKMLTHAWLWPHHSKAAGTAFIVLMSSIKDSKIPSWMNILFMHENPQTVYFVKLFFQPNCSLALFMIKSFCLPCSPPLLLLCLCRTSSLIYLPSSNVKRLWREAGSPGADCVFELMISSYSVILWSSGAYIVFCAQTIMEREICIYEDCLKYQTRKTRPSRVHFLISMRQKLWIIELNCPCASSGLAWKQLQRKEAVARGSFRLTTAYLKELNYHD